ncbi:MAG: hypothetical protein NTY19_04980 [Planctomycetota bacterium]|nr:hypothetical protein [Planctomycetota bacterium]
MSNRRSDSLKNRPQQQARQQRKLGFARSSKRTQAYRRTITFESLERRALLSGQPGLVDFGAADAPSTSPALYAGEGEPGLASTDIVRYRLSLTDTSNNPLLTGSDGNAQVAAGQTVRLHGYSQDVRCDSNFCVTPPASYIDGAAQGVFANYMDVLYTNANLIRVRYGETQQLQFIPFAQPHDPLIGGQFTLTFDGKTTSLITYSPLPEVLAPRMQLALESLSNIGSGTVRVTIPPSTTPPSSTLTSHGLKAVNKGPEPGQPNTGSFGPVGDFFNAYSQASPTEEFEFFQVDLKVLSTGTVAFSGNPADAAGTETLVFPADKANPKVVVAPANIGFVQGIANPLVLNIKPADVYVDAAWSSAGLGADPDGAGPATAFGTDAFLNFSAGLNGVGGGGTVHVAMPGTTGSDGFTFESLASPIASPNHTLLFGGTSYSVPASVKVELNVNAGIGTDTATITDRTGGLTATLRPASGTVTGLGYTVNLESAETVNLLAYSGGKAFLFDSTGDDTFLARPTGANLQGTNFNNSLTGFTQVYSYSLQGGNDTARLYDSAGDDVFLADGKANGSRLQGATLDFYAEGFKQTYAYATGGGADTAKLYDSGGADLFLADGKANGVRLQGPGVDLYAEGFEKTYAYATGGGADTAQMFDSAGPDLFLADGKANGVRLQGTGIDLYAEGFEKTYAYATGGGADTAQLFDSAGDDLFLADAKANGARLQGPGIDLYAEGFEKTYAYATKGGTDTAQLYDSAGDDTFTFDGAANGARLQGGGIDLYAEGFEKTYAYATKGGTDTATMVDSAGDDTLTFDYPGGRFQGAGFDAYAEGFDHYFASATQGGYDRSYLYDSSGNDALQGRSNWYLLTTPLATVRGDGFDYVKATKHEAGTNTLDVSAVDYLFEGTGWV